MADQKKTYPMLPIAHWWTLRKKFKQSIPGVVTDGYLATVLNMGAPSARANVLPFLKTLGIIDEDGKTTERARQWRDDAQYPGVCREILKEVYLQELRDAVTSAAQRADAVRWFLNKTGSGQSAARRMAVLYILLLEEDPSKQPDEEKGATKKSANAGTKTQKKPSASGATIPAVPVAAVHTTPASTTPQTPSININLEIHISADSTPEQIDQIFASMAKHIYRAG